MKIEDEIADLIILGAILSVLMLSYYFVGYVLNFLFFWQR